MTLSDHKASGGFCECCGVPFPCSTARKAVEGWLDRVRRDSSAPRPDGDGPVARDRAYGILSRIPAARTSSDNEAENRGAIRPGP